MDDGGVMGREVFLPPRVSCPESRDSIDSRETGCDRDTKPPATRRGVTPEGATWVWNLETLSTTRWCVIQYSTVLGTSRSRVSYWGVRQICDVGVFEVCMKIRRIQYLVLERYLEGGVVPPPPC